MNDANKPLPAGVRLWRYHDHLNHFERTTPLWLYPELEGSAMVGDLDEDDGEAELITYANWVKHRYPEWWDADAVPIYWSVHPICEVAPYQPGYRREHFLTFFNWPESDDEAEEPLDWYRLPVINTRFPEFAETLGWAPSPLQRHAPLRTIIDSRNLRKPR